LYDIPLCFVEQLGLGFIDGRGATSEAEVTRHGTSLLDHESEYKNITLFSKLFPDTLASAYCN
jgi:hypothetical protein